MKKKFLAIVFGILVLPFAFLLGGCGHEIVRYGSSLPDVFEAEMTETLGNSTKEWKIIRRQEEIEGQTIPWTIWHIATMTMVLKAPGISIFGFQLGRWKVRRLLN